MMHFLQTAIIWADFFSGINHLWHLNGNGRVLFLCSFNRTVKPLFLRWLKNFCKYFHRKPYIQGLKCRYSEGLAFVLIVLLQENQKIFPKNLHLLPLFCRYSEGAFLYQ